MKLSVSVPDEVMAEAVQRMGVSSPSQVVQYALAQYLWNTQQPGDVGDVWRKVRNIREDVAAIRKANV